MPRPPIRRLPCLGLILLPLLSAAAAHATRGMYAEPALHRDRLVFVSEGDLWIAVIPPPDPGGSEPVIRAARLTRGDGVEFSPVINPAGTALAFASQYEGNTDVYVMPIDGGEARRLTFHPADDVPVAWQPDGQAIIFRSRRSHPLQRDELFRVPLAGGAAEPLGFGEGVQLSFSPTGTRFAFVRWWSRVASWKGYRGGTAPDVWTAEPRGDLFSRLTDHPGTDLFPMWLAGRVYFVSDRSGLTNIWSDRPDGGDVRQHTQFAVDPTRPTDPAGYDIRSASADADARGSRLIFAQGWDLVLLETSGDTLRRLDIRLVTDRAAARPRFVPLADAMTAVTFGADPDTLLVEARGEIGAFDLRTHRVRQITRTPSARERGVHAMGRDRLVFISDASGEQQITVHSLAADGRHGVLTRDREEWLFPPVADRDGRHVAFADKSMRLHLIITASGERRVIDRADAGEITDYRFSPDGNWIAWTHPLATGMSVVRLHSIRSGRTFDLGDGNTIDFAPRWDPAGACLYMLSHRSFDPLVSGAEMRFLTAPGVVILAIPLRESLPPPDMGSALAAGFDIEGWSHPDADTDGSGHDDLHRDVAAAGAPDAEPQALVVEPEDAARRAWAIPVPPGNITDLEAIPGGVLFVTRPFTGLLASDDLAASQPPGQLHRWRALEQTPVLIAEGIGDHVALAPDGSRVAVLRDDGIRIVPVNEPQSAEDLPLEGHTVRVEPALEWKQVFAEAWRLQRDFFFVPDMAGVDWPLMRRRYEPFLERVGTREELGDLIREMVDELRTSHVYVKGGDRHRVEQAEPVPVGLLGADMEPGRGGRVVLRRILRAAAPDGTTFPPLAAPHLAMRDGDLLLAIDGEPLRAAADPLAMLQGAVGRTVRLTVARADGSEERVIEIEPVEDESPFRYMTWVEENRRRVAAATEGRVGYLHLPDMSALGLSLFSRQFPPQSHLPALIIDIRGNAGGFVSEMIIETLAQRVHAYAAARHGRIYRYPHLAVDAHMAALIDAHAGSDGDIFPHMFRRRGLGPLIGTRTWGGVVGIRFDKPLVDAGLYVQPEYGLWDPEHGWILENEGVAPDIDVDITPLDRRRGVDPQLDRAVELLMQRLRDAPRREGARPEPPKRR